MGSVRRATAYTGKGRISKQSRVVPERAEFRVQVPAKLSGGRLETPEKGNSHTILRHPISIHAWLYNALNQFGSRL